MTKADVKDILTIIKGSEGKYLVYLTAYPGICTQADTLEDIPLRISDAFGAMIAASLNEFDIHDFKVKDIL